MIKINTNVSTSLVVLAAGFGTRFQSGIKQLAPVGPGGELLMEYSVRDAAAAGFNKVIFVIRRDIEEQFKELIGRRLEPFIDVRYSYQNNGYLPGGFKPPSDRRKPWGTVHAVLAAKYDIEEPFAIINADDHYGKESYRLMHDYLVSPRRNAACQCMIGFVLKNTLSPTGSVTRGICIADHRGYLDTVHETYHIRREDDGAIYGDYNNKRIAIDENRTVSMNMWGFDPSIIPQLEFQFVEYLKENLNDNGSEYPLPAAIDSLIHSNQCRVKVIPTTEKWFGMTYAEDIERVRAEILLRS